MGTNYYLEEVVCPHCNKADKSTHIGKSSFGWCFSLHVYPLDGLATWAAWKERIVFGEGRIVDEYGTVIMTQDFFDVVEKRKGRGADLRKFTQKDYEMNHAEEGPNGLLRHILGKHCISHGEGPWDCIDCEFS